MLLSHKQSRKNLFFKRLLLPTIAFALAACIYSPIWCFGIVINYTESLPLGFYRKARGEPVKGSYVLFTLKDSDRPYAKGQLIKRVAAAEGDHVQITDHGICINGNAVKDSKQWKFDRYGYPLPSLVLDHVLENDELLCLGDDARSFDSRYFGVIAKSQIISTLFPVFVFYKK